MVVKTSIKELGATIGQLAADIEKAKADRDEAKTAGEGDCRPYQGAEGIADPRVKDCIHAAQPPWSLSCHDPCPLRSFKSMDRSDREKTATSTN